MTVLDSALDSAFLVFSASRRSSCRLASSSWIESSPVCSIGLVDEVVEQLLVPVRAAELVVAVDREHLDRGLGHLDQGDVEGAAAQVIDQERGAVRAAGDPVVPGPPRPARGRSR